MLKFLKEWQAITEMIEPESKPPVCFKTHTPLNSFVCETKSKEKPKLYIIFTNAYRQEDRWQGIREVCFWAPALYWHFPHSFCMTQIVMFCCFGVVICNDKH